MTQHLNPPTPARPRPEAELAEIDLADEDILDAMREVPGYLAAMHLTRTLHPPGGATALIAVIGSDQIHAMDYLFVVLPATLGPLALLVVALLVNNLPATRRYPELWL